jgi:hypothetical protein
MTSAPKQIAAALYCATIPSASVADPVHALSSRKITGIITKLKENPILPLIASRVPACKRLVIELFFFLNQDYLLVAEKSQILWTHRARPALSVRLCWPSKGTKRQLASVSSFRQPSCSYQQVAGVSGVRFLTENRAP